MSQPSVSAVIVAAGTSTRFGSPGKVFHPLLGRPVLEWSLRAHDKSPFVREIVVVGQHNDFQRITKMAERVLMRSTFRFAPGGKDRQSSVASGLSAVSEKSIFTSIHDAARPGVTPELINALVKKAQEFGAAIAALPARDTIKVVGKEGLVRRTLDRRRLWQIATPQMFQTHLIFDAYEKASGEGIIATDDAGLMERMDYPVAVVPADERILKITTRNDLLALEGMLGSGPPRVGFGYDIHATDPARPLVLGGVTFQEGPGLLGHSDADVLCHAICDALLGAAALGDIGRHFPNTDPAFKDVSSIHLLSEVRSLLESAGYLPLGVDATLIAEQPRISPRVEEMRRRISEALHIDRSQVSIKATTAEKMGPTGRGECMEAHSVAQVIQIRE